MLSAEKVPTSDGEGASFQDYEQQVRVWMCTAKMEPSNRAAASVIFTNSVARQVCLSAGGDILENADGASRMLKISRNYFAPAAADSKN